MSKPERAYAVRGNIFSFLLPWEEIQGQLADVFDKGNLAEWPLSQEVVEHLVRVRLVRGPEQLLNKFKELNVRAHVVLLVANDYIDNHFEDLKDPERGI